MSAHGTPPGRASCTSPTAAYAGSNPLELSYRQAVTPDRLQARMNATMRSFNRAAVVIGAPVGGLAADAIGFRSALWVSAAGLAVAALVLGASPFRHA